MGIFVLPATAEEATFGKTSIDSTGVFGDTYFGCSIYTMPEAGTITKISFYGSGTSGTSYGKAGIYSVTSGHPDALLAESANITLSSTEQWWNFTVNYEAEPGDYALGVALSGGGLNGVWYRLTSQPSGSSHYRTVTFSSFPNPFGAHTEGTVFYDIFATYTVGEEPEEPIPPDAWDSDLNNYFCAAILLIFGFVFMIFMVSRRRY